MTELDCSGTVNTKEKACWQSYLAQLMGVFTAERKVFFPPVDQENYRRITGKLYQSYLFSGIVPNFENLQLKI